MNYIATLQSPRAEQRLRIGRVRVAERIIRHSHLCGGSSSFVAVWARVVLARMSNEGKLQRDLRPPLTGLPQVSNWK
jgi:hypothetical protein